MRTDRLDPGRKSDRVSPLRFSLALASLFWVQSAAWRPYERTARKEERKAEGANKGENWTNQFTVFEIRLPRPTGPRLSDVQRVSRGCACTWDRPVRTLVNALFYDTDSFLLLDEIKGWRLVALERERATIAIAECECATKRH